MFISLHVITMASIVTFFSIINYKFDDQIYCIVNFGRGYNIVFFVIIGVLEVIYHAFVYAGVSRWVCPDCQKFNKSKAKFCVGCGKVRPAKPNPTPAPAHRPPQHNVTQEPAHQPYASPMPAPQPYTAPRLVSPAQNPGAFCYQCGSPITPGTIFCGQCGKPVN